jgi:hypothetical protein
MTTARFEIADLGAELPAPGVYDATVIAARLRCSARGHRMVTVTFALDGVAPGREHVADYFVLEGASARGVAVARWRLVALYRACGHAPQGGEEIRPAVLVGARVVVTLEHQHRAGRTWVRVAGYYPPGTGPVLDEVPF